MFVCEARRLPHSGASENIRLGRKKFYSTGPKIT
jgi:hypothetical protein